MFGKKFYKALRTATKIRKSTKEISHHITGSTSRPSPQVSRGKRYSRQDSRSSRPFRRGPSFQSRGGGKSVSFRGKGSNYKGYPKGKSVKFRVKKRAPESKRQAPDCKRNSGDVITDSPNRHPTSSKKTRVGHISFKQVSAIGRETPVFSNQLEITDTRSVHFTNSHCCGDSLSTNSTPDKYAPSYISQSVRERKHRAGNCSDVAKRGDSGGLSNERGVYQSNISGSEERRGEQTSDQPQEVEFPHSVSTLQNGGIAPPQTYNSGKGFHDQDRSQRCLLLCTHEPAASAFPEVHLGGTRYQFTCLPFGLAPAPLYFTKLLKPVMALSRRLGLRMIIVFNQTREGILRDRDSTLWLLQNLGFVINWKKSVLDPSHCMEYLGFVINSMEMNLSLPKEKMNQLIQSCRDLIRDKTASVRTLTKIIGKLTSSMQAVLPAPLHYRHLQMLQVKGLLAGKSYETMVSLNQNCQNDLQWWVDQISTWNGRSITTPATDLVITTDASLQGWGAVCQGVRTRGLWSQQ